jgi:hypothetical protein
MKDSEGKGKGNLIHNSIFELLSVIIITCVSENLHTYRERERERERSKRTNVDHFANSSKVKNCIVNKSTNIFLKYTFMLQKPIELILLGEKKIAL